MARDRATRAQERADRLRKPPAFDGENLGGENAAVAASQSELAVRNGTVKEARAVGAEQDAQGVAASHQSGSNAFRDDGVKVNVADVSAEPSVPGRSSTVLDTHDKGQEVREGNDSQGKDDVQIREQDHQGARLKREEPEPEADPETDPDPASDGHPGSSASGPHKKRSQGSKVCPSCSYHNAVAVADCRECGHVFYVRKNVQILKRECPQCQWSNKVSAKTCRGCGFSFQKHGEQKKIIQKPPKESTRVGAKDSVQYYQLGPAFNGL